MKCFMNTADLEMTRKGARKMLDWVVIDPTITTTKAHMARKIPQKRRRRALMGGAVTTPKASASDASTQVAAGSNAEPDHAGGGSAAKAKDDGGDGESDPPPCCLYLVLLLLVLLLSQPIGTPNTKNEPKSRAFARRLLDLLVGVAAGIIVTVITANLIG